MSFKQAADNSTIKEIGPLYRRHGHSNWNINIILEPAQNRRFFGISQLRYFARRRILNPTHESHRAGFQQNMVIDSTRKWGEGPIHSCSIPAVRRLSYGNEWCFIFQNRGITFFLPQLELARVLFFHSAYLARQSLIHGGLSQEFDIHRPAGKGEARVNILPTCTAPLLTRSDHSQRRVLAWILLVSEARESYDSIAKRQLIEGYDTERYRMWHFRFTPPALSGAHLSVRGHFDQDREAFFVYEIDKVTNIPKMPLTEVEFIDPRYLEDRTGPSHVGSQSGASFPDIEIDDEEMPGADNTELNIDSPEVVFEFLTPFRTTRVGPWNAKARVRGFIDVVVHPNAIDPEPLVVSTDESSILGNIPAAEFSGLNDISDDAYLYADKFDAFGQMVAELSGKPDCIHLQKEIRKLPSLGGFSKHLLSDGNPRCLAFHLVQVGNTVFALLEVDTSDNSNRLSTLILKQKISMNASEWSRYLHSLELHLLTGSLVWPTSYLKKTYGTGFMRILHPRSSSSNKALLEPSSIYRWAERVYSELISF